MDAPTSQQITELRREIEGIQELNAIYRSKGRYHGHQDHAENERRKARLEEIVRQLAVLRSK